MTDLGVPIYGWWVFQKEAICNKGVISGKINDGLLGHMVYQEKN